MRKIIAVVLTAVIATTGFTANDPEPPPATDPGVADPGTVLDFWTEENLDSAEPLPPPDVPSEPASTARRRTIATTLVKTPAGDANGYAPVTRPYDQDAIIKNVGALFMVDPVSGRRAICSASLVHSQGGTAQVLTAAHCVYNQLTKTWFTHTAFVPAYGSVQDRQRPYGIWPGIDSKANPIYVSAGAADWLHDVALVELGPDAQGRRIQDVLGAGLPIRYSKNGEAASGLTTMGYPADYDYSGDRMYSCLAEATEGWPFSGPGLLRTRNCHLHRGHSGGPLVTSDGAVLAVASTVKTYENSQGQPIDDRAGYSNLARLSASTLGPMQRLLVPAVVVPATPTPQVVETPMRADLRLAARTSKASMGRGKKATYRLRILNVGPAPADGTLVIGKFAKKVTVTKVSGPGCRKWTRTISCRVGRLEPGVQLVYVTVKSNKKNKGLAVTNFRIMSPILDVAPGNNRAAVRQRIT